ncbi:putative ribonuclease H-like domain-containing protein [Tanacetum coccineum]
MAFSDSEVYNDKTCSKNCLKNYETLKKQCDDLIVKLNQTEFIAATYKRGLETVEEQLITYRKNEVLFSKEVTVLKREVACKDYEINMLKSEFEKVKQEKKGIEFKIKKFDKASKDLDKLLGSQITDKSKKGLGYSAVPPPHLLIYNRPKKLDLSYSGLDELKEPEFKAYGSEVNQVSKDTSSFVESSLNVDKETIFPVDKKINCNHHQRKRIVSRNNYNGVDYDYYAKATHPSVHMNMTPRAVLLKTGLTPLNTVRPVNIDHPKPAVHSAKTMTSNNRMTYDLLTVDAQGKQHKASCKSKVLNPITKPLFMLHMDLFGPTFVSSLMHKKYCLVVIDDYSRFTWVFFLTTKDETSEILKNFIKEIENLMDKKVKIIRSDNKTDFKNKVMDDFCREKGIKREYSVARTPQQNGIAERRNMTLIEAARTMLADSKLPTTFWAEAVSTACYVQNRVLVVKPHNKTPYELFRGFKLSLSFMRPFGCHVIILNTLDSLGKFDDKSDEGFFVGYSLSSKAFRVYNTRTRRVEENLHIGFLENKPMIEGNGPKWLFDIDSLTQSMNYVLVTAGTIINESVGTQGELNAGTSEEISQDCIVMPIWKDASYFDSPSKDVDNGEPKSATDDQKQIKDGPDNENDEKDKYQDDSSPKEINTDEQHVNTASLKVNIDRFKLNTVGPSVSIASSYDQDSPKDMFTMGASHTLKATHVEFFNDEDEPKVNLGNITNSYTVPTTPNTRIYKDHPIKNVIGDVKSSVQIKRMAKSTSEQGFLSAMEAMQEELLQFKLQQVWILMDLPIGKRAIGTKWVFRIKKDERGIVIRNKASAFLYGTIEEEVYVTQPPGFKEPDHPDKVYKVYVDGIIFGSTNNELCTGVEKLMKDKFQMSYMGELTFFLGLQVQQKEDGIFISQDKYVAEILKKFNYTDVKSVLTPVDLEKPLVKDGDADADANDVDVYLYRSMIRSLMYLTASRPDIMFVVCACARFQVTPKTSHLLAVKRIFRYLKGKPALGLWYSRASSFELVAYTDSDYAGATQDKKSTTGGC